MQQSLSELWPGPHTKCQDILVNLQTVQIRIKILQIAQEATVSIPNGLSVLALETLPVYCLPKLMPLFRKITQ